MITILIPTLNEKKNISILCKLLLSNEQLSKIISKILFIDDNSQDGSIKELKIMSIKYEKVNFIIRKNIKKDLTQSILLGLKEINSEYICVMDGDLQHDINAIPIFYNSIIKNNYDLIVGSRYLKNNSLSELKLYRKMISKAATTLCIFLGINNISDPLSGYFLIKTSLFKSISKKITTNGYKILITILFLLNNAIRVKEIQVNFYARKHGFSKLNLKVIFNFLLQVIQLLIFRFSSSAKRNTKTGN